MVVGWDRFAKDDTPCPVVITPDEIDAAVKRGKELEVADENKRMLRNYVGYGPETHVPTIQYEKSYGIQSGDEAEDVGGVFGGQRDGG